MRSEGHEATHGRNDSDTDRRKDRPQRRPLLKQSPQVDLISAGTLRTEPGLPGRSMTLIRSGCHMKIVNISAGVSDTNLQRCNVKQQLVTRIMTYSAVVISVVGMTVKSSHGLVLNSVGARLNVGVAAHNVYRDLHCVPRLQPSVNLINAATAWARTCPAYIDPTDHKVKFRHSGSYGENLYWMSGPFTWNDVVSTWYNEIAAYNYNNAVYSPGTGHFTQVVWRSTTSVGCGFAHCSGNYGNYTFVVCRYNPPGNYSGQFSANVTRRCR